MESVGHGNHLLAETYNDIGNEVPILRGKTLLANRGQAAVTDYEGSESGVNGTVECVGRLEGVILVELGWNSQGRYPVLARMRAKDAKEILTDRAAMTSPCEAQQMKKERD